jgi:hypothetical protein
MGKIPDSAFSEYLSLGAGRSYQALADSYGCTKRAVAKLAARENWQERLEEIERSASAEVEQRAVDSIKAIIARHLKTIRWVQGKALETLKDTPLRSTSDALKALEFSLREERLLTRADDPDAASADSHLEEYSPEFLKELHRQAHEFVHRREKEEKQRQS